MSLAAIKKELRKCGSAKKARLCLRFFKTGKGEYGEGDIFLGVSVPQLRLIAEKFSDSNFATLTALIKSPLHEERLVALMILVLRFKKAGLSERAVIYAFYVRHLKFVNNWDLVDSSADKIAGNFLEAKNKKPLFDWARSKNLWERRVAIVSTFHFIRRNRFKETLKISQALLADKEDLIHKAVGWMLREVGKRHTPTMEGFLKKHHRRMPRTMLRYAIERFPQKKRLAYLKGEIS